MAVTSRPRVGDPAATQIVYGVIIALVVIGVVLVVLAVWLIRQTRPDPELLAPLERMQSRRWRSLDTQARRRSLDEVRPEGARPLERPSREPDLDREFTRPRPVTDFDDLVDADVVEETADADDAASAGDDDAVDDAATAGDDDPVDDDAATAGDDGADDAATGNDAVDGAVITAQQQRHSGAP